MNNQRERKRGAAVALAAGLAAMALTAVLAAVAVAAPRLDFIHLRNNLSATSTRISSYPDMAVSSDGDRVAVVWVEEYEPYAYSKGHVHLRAASESGGGWGSKLSVFSGSDSAYALDASVAVWGNKAHVAYVVRTSTQYQVRYEKCNLDTEGCNIDLVTVRSVSGSSAKITWVDLAVDGDGNPHVVWAQYDASGQNGDIYYNAYNGSSWGTQYAVDPSGKDCNTPAIAWADDYAHVVWENENDDVIQYRRRDTTTADPDDGWDAVSWVTNPQSIWIPRNPDVAARAGKVFVVWDRCANYFGEGGGDPCEMYALNYRRSIDNGGNWVGSAYEVGTGRNEVDENHRYYSVDSGRDEFLWCAQPSIALNEQGGPAIVWHADRSGAHDGSDYAIYYSYAYTGGTASPLGINWLVTHTVLNRHQPSMLGSATVGAVVSGTDTLMHLAYMGETTSDAWDVYYDSNIDPDIYNFIYLPLILRNY